MSARSCRASTPNGYRFDVPLGGRITGVKRGFESRRSRFRHPPFRPAFSEFVGSTGQAPISKWSRSGLEGPVAPVDFARRAVPVIAAEGA
jgi:hypothetical protein